MKRAREGRGEMLWIALLCGVPCLLAGIAGAAAVAINWSDTQRFELYAAGSVAVMGLVFGVAFIVAALPERWGVARRLWRSCGWLPPLALLPLAFLLLRYPVTAALHSSRIGSSIGAVISGLGILFLSWNIARMWWSAREHRR